jgi:hypothetical protein
VSLVNLTSGQTFINSMAVNVREGFQLPGDGRFFSYSLARVGVTSDTRITGMMAYFSTRVKASLVICNLGRAIRQSACRRPLYRPHVISANDSHGYIVSDAPRVLFPQALLRAFAMNATHDFLLCQEPVRH